MIWDLFLIGAILIMALINIFVIWHLYQVKRRTKSASGLGIAAGVLTGVILSESNFLMDLPESDEDPDLEIKIDLESGEICCSGGCCSPEEPIDKD